MKAVVISGLLYDLSDNIIPFLDKNTDLYVHTWQEPENSRWISKLKRYKKYCRNLTLETEPFKFEKKLFSYFYSTYKAVNLIDSANTYKEIVKFKPNLDTDRIIYRGSLQEYFNKAKTHSRPMLEKYSKEDCFFGLSYFYTFDERLYSGYHNSFKKAFSIVEEDFIKLMLQLDGKLIEEYGINYEGSIFWTKWFESRDIKLILDIDLKLSNNVRRN